MTLARLSPPSLVRLGLGVALLILGIAIFVGRPAIAFAHHVELAKSTTCNSYLFEADYIGGEGARYAEVRVDGTLVGTFNFPADSGNYDNFYVNSGPLPANITVEVKLFRPVDGPDTLIDTDAATVNTAATCATWTPTSTPTQAATSTPTSTATQPPTDTPTATATAAPTETPASTDTPDPTETPTQTPTAVASATNTPPATGTPVSATSTPDASTQTPVPTATTEPGETPTYVSTVESLLPPGRPETSENPPSETASGLPDAGDGGVGANGLLHGLFAAIIAGLGLAVMGSGLRRGN